MSFSRYILEKRRTENPTLAMTHDLFINQLFSYLKQSEYKVYLVDLYHHPITYDELPVVNLDSILAFGCRKKLPLAQRVVIPLKHKHLKWNNFPIFLCTNMILRFERLIEENSKKKVVKEYYVRYGAEWRKFIPEEMKVSNEKLEIKIDREIFVVKFYEYWYEYLKGEKKTMIINWQNIRTVLDQTSGLFKQKVSRLKLGLFYISYIAVIPVKLLEVFKRFLIGNPVGESSIITNIVLTELNVKEDDVFFASTSDGKWVLLKTIPYDAIPEDKVIYPVITHTYPFILYNKHPQTMLCYTLGTVLVEKPELW